MLWRGKSSLGTKPFDKRNPSMWTSFLRMLRHQTLSQYLSPDSIYSAQHSTHLHSHLVSQSLLSTALLRSSHFLLQMAPALHSAVCTYSFHGYMHSHSLWPNLLLLVIHLSLFLHAWPSDLLRGGHESLKFSTWMLFGNILSISYVHIEVGADFV